MTATSGASYAPEPIPDPVVGPGDFPFAAIGLDHGHIFGMCEGLEAAGGTVTWVYDPDPAKVEVFRGKFPGARVARSEQEVFDDDAVRLVAGAAVTSERCALGLRAIEAGKHYFTDKAPLTTLDQLAAAREATARTGLKYAVYYSERLHVEAAVLADQLVERGAIGRVLQVMGLGPHRLGTGRPDWFFEKEKYGGILCDIGSHNFEQMLHYAGAKDARVTHAAIANYHNPEHPGLDDFGEANIVMDNGATGYCRVDWFTPDGLSTWGDGRTFLLGTDGYIELRKYVNVATEKAGGHVFLVNDDGEQHLVANGNVGFPYFGRLIRDCLDGTETAMTQEHAFKAAELSVQAQLRATDLTPR
ncbi:Gfo/Idh/MocA family oxidoreductase [Myceligenerans crystallogenes]|uniref:Gfo/Idh/MocA family oxidoreductase n=1 Tax=Myceligenerans crystallogenes TaxID=316335 RepID=A0ABN2N273_9MICO